MCMLVWERWLVHLTLGTMSGASYTGIDSLCLIHTMEMIYAGRCVGTSMTHKCREESACVFKLSSCALHWVREHLEMRRVQYYQDGQSCQGKHGVIVEIFRSDAIPVVRFGNVEANLSFGNGDICCLLGCKR